MHPHNNMEIISIPLEGDLEHRDSMGNKKVICEGEIQVMSAGTGVMHSEYNRNMDRPVKFLQIWLFPNQKNVEPRYDQQSINFLKKKNAFYQILSPNPTEQGVWIHQDAWFSMGDFEQGVEVIYPIHKKGNGIYLFVIEGSCEVAGVLLDRRDGFGAWNTESIPFKATGSCRVLLMEVPMAQQQ